MMYSRLRALGLASLVIGGLSFAFAPSFADQGTSGSSGRASGDRSNTNMADAKGISQAIGQCCQAALNPSGWDQLVQCFSKQDQQRLQQNEKEKQPNQQYLTSAQNFQKNWRSKYNGDFTVANADQLFGEQFFKISQPGEARPAGGKIEGGSSGTSGSSSGTSGTSGTSSGTSGTSGSSSSGTSSGTSGTSTMQTTMVTIPASHGQPEVMVNFVNENGQWKIQLPASVTRDQLQNQLAQHLDQLNRDQQYWPKDQNEAQRLVAHHVLAAISGTSLSGAASGSNTGTTGQNK